MKHAAFFDTNVFVYADDNSAPGKQERAIEIVARYYEKGLAIVSLQAMQE